MTVYTQAVRHRLSSVVASPEASRGVDRREHFRPRLTERRREEHALSREQVHVVGKPVRSESREERLGRLDVALLDRHLDARELGHVQE